MTYHVAHKTIYFFSIKDALKVLSDFLCIVFVPRLEGYIYFD